MKLQNSMLQKNMIKCLRRRCDRLEKLVARSYYTLGDVGGMAAFPELLNDIREELGQPRIVIAHSPPPA